MKPILVTCYVNPDLDGFAGAVAYAEFLNKSGQNAKVGILGTPHDEVKYVLERFNISSPMEIADADGYDEVILVDASDLNGLEGKVRPEKVIEIIDHRKINEAEKFLRAKAQIELVGAAATLVGERFRQGNMTISKEAALLVFSAIISNTLNFRGSVTTERDRAVADWLRPFVQLSENYWKELFLAKSDLSGGKLAQRIEGDFAWFELGGKRVGVAQLEVMEAEKLIDQRGKEIVEVLRKIKKGLNLDLIFQNTIDLGKSKNLILAYEKEMEKLLEKILDIKFIDGVAVREQLIMRKQIIPLLKEELENQQEYVS